MQLSKFTLGSIAGFTGAAVAVPVLAQFALAATGPAESQRIPLAPTEISQSCLSALADRDAAELERMDARFAAHKAALTAHQEALADAADITDPAARLQAFKDARTAMMEAMKAAMPDREEMQAVHEALKEACGDTIRALRGPGPHGPGGQGGPGMRFKMRGGPRGQAPADTPVDPASITLQ